MKVTEKLALLKNLMQQYGIDYYYIPPLVVSVVFKAYMTDGY